MAMGMESALRRAGRDRARRAAPPAERDTAPAAKDGLLDVRGLRVEFGATGGSGQLAVRDLDVTLDSGRVVGVAGESGSGKSSLALAVMGLLPPGSAVDGSIRYAGDELVGLPEKRLRAYRGSRIAMVSQESIAALNPTIRVGQQMRLVLRAHFSRDRAQLDERMTQALRDVQLHDVERVLRSYPSELSGGMCQRVVIAMALACGSDVLLADEPTTALDVTVQSEIIKLLRGLVAERNLALMMISHDLAVLNEICDDLVVMYQGEVVEAGPIADVLGKPAHPYTRSLLNAIPRLANRGMDLPTLQAVRDAPATGGCRFAGRCPWRVDGCDEPQALLPFPAAAATPARRVRCHRADRLAREQEVLS
jgi:oligopeptide/dipeptide ABC transporter ATP-binding protein